MPDRVLVDTSAWIDFFRKKNLGRHELVANLLREEKAVGTGIIALELLRGAKTVREVNVVLALFETIENVYELPTTCIDAGKMGYELARQGHTFGVVDLLIAQIVIENELLLLTLDDHFKVIATSFPIKLLPFPKTP